MDPLVTLEQCAVWPNIRSDVTDSAARDLAEN